MRKNSATSAAPQTAPQAGPQAAPQAGPQARSMARASGRASDRASDRASRPHPSLPVSPERIGGPSPARRAAGRTGGMAPVDHGDELRRHLYGCRAVDRLPHLDAVDAKAVNLSSPRLQPYVARQ